MQDKYFTPSIEDIRVGYECELGSYTYDFTSGSSKATEVWETKVLNAVDVATKIQIKPILDTVRNAETIWLRVPYLTKEQIEAEGWKARGSEGYYYKKCNKVVYLPNNNNIMLITQFTERPLENEIFKGECKDINTFRYICKLLGI